MKVEALYGHEPSGEWAGRETELEGALEGFVESLTRSDRAKGLQLAYGICERALPMAIAGFEASGMDFGDPRDPDGWGDTGSAVEQLEQIKGALEGGFYELTGVIDYTRQLNVWDEDLRPAGLDTAYLWYLEAPNLLAMAVVHEESGPYGTWAGPICAGRAAVCAFKSALQEGREPAELLVELLA